MPDEFYFSANGFAALGRDFYAASLAARTEAGPTLERIGHDLEKKAKQIADQRSKSVSPTIHGHLYPGEYRIQAGGEESPIASLWELGNRHSESQDQFEHPVFGNYPMVWQWRYPFFRPALAQERERITLDLEEMWDRVLTPYRLRPTIGL